MNGHKAKKPLVKISIIFLITNWFLACYNYEILDNFCENSDYFADNFEILELVGHGGFSVVYKVRSKRDDQIFALKKTKTSFKGSNDRYFNILYLTQLLINL